ncbi:GntR family transcriptional regulator [Sciscionella marina]|uniref:GntR family transcriptional regulator n=1 Tax=Sciscionella marina TaxID=508770 RepID=UPI00036520A6|nr:GntR family transcriptional regulator [Sciscionella marina]
MDADKPGLNRRQLSDDVAAHLRDRIMSGALKPGTYIRIDQLAGELGISATPVREALAALRGEDMVSLQPSKGFAVNPLSRRDVGDLFQVQADIAGRLAGRAAARVTTDQLEELTGIQTELARAVRNKDAERIERLEFAFHRGVNLVADSRKLAWVLRNASLYLPQSFYSSDAGWRRGLGPAHRAILEALRAADEQAARSAMAKHVLDGERRLVKHLDEGGIWAADQPRYVAGR